MHGVRVIDDNDGAIPVALLTCAYTCQPFLGRWSFYQMYGWWCGPAVQLIIGMPTPN